MPLLSLVGARKGERGRLDAVRAAQPKPVTRGTLAGCFAASVVAMIYAGTALTTHDYPVLVRVLLILLFPAVVAGDLVLVRAYRQSRRDTGVQ